MLLQRLGPLDAQQREEHERDDSRAQAVERRADRAVDLTCDLDDTTLLDRRQREQDAGTGHALAIAEQRRGVLDHAELREQAVAPAIRRIAIGREYQRLVVDRGRRSGQVWVRSLRGGGGGHIGARCRSGHV